MSETVEIPDLASMDAEQIKAWMLSLSEEQLAEWFLNNDLSAVLRKLPSESSPSPVELVGPVPEDKLVRASFRIDSGTLAWLAQAAGRDREGKSGIVRQALAEFRARHPELAA